MSSRLTKLAASYVPGTALPPSPHWGARIWGVVVGTNGVVAGTALGAAAQPEGVTAAHDDAQPEGVTAAHDDAAAACIEGDAGSSGVPYLGTGEDGAPP